MEEGFREVLVEELLKGSLLLFVVFLLPDP
jgi:hypothetical protein